MEFQTRTKREREREKTLGGSEPNTQKNTEQTGVRERESLKTKSTTKLMRLIEDKSEVERKREREFVVRE